MANHTLITVENFFQNFNPLAIAVVHNHFNDAANTLRILLEMDYMYNRFSRENRETLVSMWKNSCKLYIQKMPFLDIIVDEYIDEISEELADIVYSITES